VNLNNWAQNADVGERVVYHRGVKSPPPAHVTDGNRLSDTGLVFLAQRRRPEGGFDYEATRISHVAAIRLGLRSGRRQPGEPLGSPMRKVIG
jgi:hypothetical protein